MKTEDSAEGGWMKREVISKDNPRKPQTPAEKKVRAQKAKVDAENAAERKKRPITGSLS